MSAVLKLGYKCFPMLIDRDPNALQLASQYQNKPYKLSKQEPFEKDLLTYRVMRYYRLMYDKLINNN